MLANGSNATNSTNVSNTTNPTNTTSNTNTMSNTNTTSNTNNSTTSAPPPAPPLPLPTKTTTNEDSVEMQSIESFKLKDTPNPVIPKPPPTYFPLSNSSSPASNGSPRHAATGNKTQVIKEKDQSTSPSNETNKNSTTNNNAVSPNGTAGPLKPTVGKVAIRIGAYEGEAKQPAKLDFLAQQPRAEKNGTDEANGPVVSRLQNELAATLQRSNLRRKTEGVRIYIYVLSNEPSSTKFL